MPSGVLTLHNRERNDSVAAEPMCQKAARKFMNYEEMILEELQTLFFSYHCLIFKRLIP